MAGARHPRLGDMVRPKGARAGARRGPARCPRDAGRCCFGSAGMSVRLGEVACGSKSRQAGHGRRAHGAAEAAVRDVSFYRSSAHADRRWRRGRGVVNGEISWATARLRLDAVAAEGWSRGIVNLDQACGGRSSADSTRGTSNSARKKQVRLMSHMIATPTADPATAG